MFFFLFFFRIRAHLSYFKKVTLNYNLEKISMHLLREQNVNKNIRILWTKAAIFTNIYIYGLTCLKSNYSVQLVWSIVDFKIRVEKVMEISQTMNYWLASLFIEYKWFVLSNCNENKKKHKLKEELIFSMLTFSLTHLWPCIYRFSHRNWDILNEWIRFLWYVV